MDIELIAKDFLDKKRSNRYRDWFFPYLINELGYKSVIEVGTNVGDYSKCLLNACRSITINCIDSYPNGFGSEGYCDSSGDLRLEKARCTLKQYLECKRVTILRMTSLDASFKFPNDSIDFAYLDGDHTLEGVILDLNCWINKVKKDGIIAGHDYKDGPNSGITDWQNKQLPYGVKTAVDRFCARYNYKLNVVGGRIKNFWFVKS